MSKAKEARNSNMPALTSVSVVKDRLTSLALVFVHKLLDYAPIGVKDKHLANLTFLREFRK